MNNMFDALGPYEQKMEELVQALTPSQAFAFALACTERQLPIYEKASVGKPWNSIVVRRSIDQAWNHIIKGTSLPDNLSTQCKEGIPNLDEFLVDASDVAAHLIGTSVFDLLTAMENNESHYCYFPAARNIDLLEMLYDEYDERGEDESNSQVQHLTETEIERQDTELTALRFLGAQQIQQFRHASQKSLFGDMWFPK